MTPLLSLENLCVALRPGSDRTHAIQDISLKVGSNELLCVVGESGSGKSILAHAIMGLLPSTVGEKHGQIFFDGREIGGLAEEEARRLRGTEIAMIFQEPMTALNPLMRVGDQIDEVLRYHTAIQPKDRRVAAEQALKDVGLPDIKRIIRSYPFQLSGGQRQRVMIAMSLVLEPKLLLADEPTTALDVTTQGKILQLIRELQQKKHMSVVFITHDFGVVEEIADRVVVMQQGRLVEEGNTQSVLRNPQHAYTKKLVAAVPKYTRRQTRSVAEHKPVLAASDVGKNFYLPTGFLSTREIAAVKDVSIDLFPGECLGIVGESGSGKSTFGRLLMRLIDPDQGTIRLGGTDIGYLKGDALRNARRRIQMVFQDPYSSLNPRRRIGDQIMSGLLSSGVPKAKAQAKAEELLNLVGLETSSIYRYPHQFSGGQRQRIAIARALALQPEIVIADEPVSALDVTVQDQVLQLFEKIRDELGVSLVFITHDLRVAARMSDRVAVMSHGSIVEIQPTNGLFDNPREEYTKKLISAVPGAGWIDAAVRSDARSQSAHTIASD
ncbi:MAG: ABC transporter ATP-binding protein [Rhizobiales bacterium]|nr:ABC transporter ATP-binding protein [Hyphomicrobiales bacterium]